MISNLNAIDSRSPWHQIRRNTLRKGMKRLGIEFSVKNTHEELINICKGKNLQPQDIVNFVPVKVADKVQMVPENKIPSRTDEEEERIAIEFERRLEEQANEIREQERKAKEEKETEIQELRRTVDELKKFIMDQAKIPQPSDPIEAMKMPQLKKYAKEIGLKIPITMKKDEIIEAIREHLEKIPSNVNGVNNE